MAETLLSPVIEKFGELLVKEAKSLKGIHKEVESLKDELEIIQSYLKDVDQRSRRGGDTSEALKTWVKQVREEADRIEDVIDEYRSHVAERNRFGRFVGETCCVIKTLKQRYDIVSKIRDTNESLFKIKERAERFGLIQGSSSTRGSENVEVGHDIARISSLYLEDDELVGINSTSQDLVTKLVGGESARSVISLVGQGGIGKTTLAMKVYKDEAVKGHFDCRAWITVSQSSDVEKLLKDMKNQICPTKERPMEQSGATKELIDLLRSYMKTKRYVVVFDDIWQRDFWEVIKHALPSNDKGSRIIMTTRITTVAYSIKETPCDFVQEIKPWSLELGFELFCRKAFRFEFERHCPQELEQLSFEIVSKCQGLPLVIAAIASLLSTKEKVKNEWQGILDILNYEFEINPQLSSVFKVLSLSYHDLPYHLKRCFLYFGIFPENYSIVEGNLYRFWIAEGFITSKRGKTSEEVAEEYLNELIHRNLVLLELRYGFQKWCKVHDLMRDIILREANELSFFQTLNEKISRTKQKGRRLSINGTTENVLEIVGDSGIRSVLLFDVNEVTKSFMVGLFENFKLLKVLNFADTPLDMLPKEVGNLFHLEYLNLRCTKIKKLPKSIGKLCNLKALDVTYTLVQELPIEINKLRNLRHLVAYPIDKETEYSIGSYPGVKMYQGVGNLEELQTLTNVELVLQGKVAFVEELEKLKKLKVLSISKLSKQIEKTLAASIEKMSCLEELYLTSVDEAEILDLKCISSPPLLLRNVSLRCRLQEFPYWISKLQNLRGLTLQFSRLIDDPLNCLKGMPNLAYVRFYQAYIGEELHFEVGGFQKLKQLELRKLEGLKVVKIDHNGALPLLEDLNFGLFPQMKEMSFDIQHLKNLKSLQIEDMPKEFVVSLQPNGGPDYWKIKHVPSVRFSYKREGSRSYDKFKLGSSELLQRMR